MQTLQFSYMVVHQDCTYLTLAFALMQVISFLQVYMRNFNFNSPCTCTVLSITLKLHSWIRGAVLFYWTEYSAERHHLQIFWRSNLTAHRQSRAFIGKYILDVAPKWGKHILDDDAPSNKNRFCRNLTDSYNKEPSFSEWEWLGADIFCVHLTISDGVKYLIFGCLIGTT